VLDLLAEAERPVIVPAAHTQRGRLAELVEVAELLDIPVIRR